MRRRIVIAGVVVLVLGGAAAAAVLYRVTRGHDIRGSSTIEFVTTVAAPKPPPSVPWSMFGRDETRSATIGGAGLRPPFVRTWAAGGRSLIEFPPVIGYGRLFYADGGGRVYALSAENGNRAWVYVSHRGVAASPAIGPFAHGTLYEAFLNTLGTHTKDASDGEVVAIAVGTGAVRWRSHVGASETSPLLVNGRVYVGGWDGKIYALDAQTGRRLWSFQTGGAVKGGLASSGPNVYVGSYDGHVYALDAVTGKLVWRASARPGLFRHATFYATPAVAYGRVYIGSTDGNVYSFGATSGELRWSHHTGSYVYGSAAVSHARVFVGSYDHSFYAFNAATGTELWRFTANGKISGSATVIDGVVYFASLGGKTYALDTRSGHLLWSFADGDYAPAVADRQHLYVVGYGTIYGLRAR